VTVLLLALALATPPPLSLSISVSPPHAPLLTAVSVIMTVTNRSRSPITLEFPTPDVFFIQVTDGHGKVFFDSRTGHEPIPVHHKMLFAIGRTKVAQYDWNGLSDDRHVLAAPGQYVIHVEMPAVSTTLNADVPFSVDAPQKINSLPQTSTAITTIAGDAAPQPGVTYLSDDTGSIALSVPLGLRPQGGFVVRGSVQKIYGQRKFVVIRFAPAADNLEPEAAATPRVLLTPPLPIPPRSR
jgi:hypothetical protein